MKLTTALLFGVAIASGYTTQVHADPAAILKACQKDMIAQCAEHMNQPDGLKACMIAKRDKMSPDCQKMMQKPD